MVRRNLCCMALILVIKGDVDWFQSAGPPDNEATFEMRRQGPEAKDVAGIFTLLQPFQVYFNRLSQSLFDTMSALVAPAVVVGQLRNGEATQLRRSKVAQLRC